ncbi:MAG: hypothetical protein KC516_01690 [Nanoarchaeota archaeon]|nr:hypothetical protein [Nanoarchaeota archaeon]
MEKNKFYDDGKRNLLYLGITKDILEEKNIHKFIYYSQSSGEETMNKIEVPLGNIFEKDTKVIINWNNVFTSISRPNDIGDKFKELKEIYENALERELELTK